MDTKHDYTPSATPFLLITPPFCLGIAAAGMGVTWGTAVITAGILLLASLPLVLKRNFQPLIATMFVALGYLNGAINIDLESSLPIGQKQEFISQINSIPSTKGRYQTAIAKILWAKEPTLGWQPTNATCQLNIDTTIKVTIGDIIDYKARNYDFDSIIRNYYRSQGLSCRHYIYQATKIKSDTTISMQVDLWRTKMAERIAKASPNDTQAIAIMQALTVGQRNAISKQTNSAYRAAGASHLLAISGLHVGIIFAIVSFLLAGLNLLGDTRWWQFAIVISVIWGYAIISGMSASVIRAVIMFSFIRLGMIKGQRSGLNTLLLAAFLMLVYRAEYLWDVGFALSYMAMLGITILYKPIAHLWRPKIWILRALWSVIVVSFAAQIFTLPIVAYLFNQISIVGLAVNLVVWITVPIIIVTTLIYMMMNWTLIGLIATTVTNLQNSIMEFVGTKWWATVDIAPFPGWVLGCSYLLLIPLAMIWNTKSNKDTNPTAKNSLH